MKIKLIYLIIGLIVISLILYFVLQKPQMQTASEQKKAGKIKKGLITSAFAPKNVNPYSGE